MNKLVGGYGSRLLKYKNNFTKRIVSILYPPAPFLNVINKKNRHFIQLRVFGEKSNLKVLDIGSGLTKGPGSWLWKDISSHNTTRVDIVDGPNIDLVADATDLPIDDGSYDSVVIQSVAEHIEDTDSLMSECVRILKSGGCIYLEMPFLQGVHGDPDDFWRMTLNGLESRMTKLNLEPLSLGVSGGPIGTMVWIFCDFFSNIIKNNIFNFTIRFLLRWLFAPLRFLDFLLINTNASKRLSCEHYFLGTKK